MNVRKIPGYVYILVGIMALSGTFIFSYINAHDTAVDFETRIEAQWENNRNVLSQYTLKIEEAIQIPAIYKDDFKEVITSSMNGRYGKNGSRATIQWFKEHSITLPKELYLQIQQIIESGRNHFENEQKKLIDLTRSYKKTSRLFWIGKWMKIAGFPSQDWDWNKYNIVLEETSKTSFETGEAKPIKLR